MANSCYGPTPCDPQTGGCESPTVGEYFIRHVPEGWQILFADDKIPPHVSSGEISPLPTRQDAESLVREMAVADFSKLFGVSKEVAGKMCDESEVFYVCLKSDSAPGQIVVSRQGAEVGRIARSDGGDWWEPVVTGRVRLIRVELAGFVCRVAFVAPRGAACKFVE